MLSPALSKECLRKGEVKVGLSVDVTADIILNRLIWRVKKAKQNKKATCTYHLWNSVVFLRSVIWVKQVLTDTETEEVFNSAEEQSLKFHKVYLILYCFLVDGHV